MRRGAALLLLLIAACARAPDYDRAAEERAIRQVIADMEAAWNRGDFRGYMAGFRKPDVVFVSRGQFQRDWQGTLDHYIRDYGGDPARRGRLHFFDIRVEMLGPDAAQLISRYRLEGGGQPQDDGGNEDDDADADGGDGNQAVRERRRFHGFIPYG